MDWSSIVGYTMEPLYRPKTPISLNSYALAMCKIHNSHGHVR